jgi:hypothetical protein
MALATWVDIYGSGATASTVGGKVQVTFFPENLPNSGLGDVAGSYILTTTNAPEKSLAALTISNSKRTFTEVDNNVTVEPGFAGVSSVQRNNTGKWQQDFTTTIYTPASIPTVSDPDNV